MQFYLILILLNVSIGLQLYAMDSANISQEIFEQANSQFKNVIKNGDCEQVKSLLNNYEYCIRSFKPGHTYVLQLIKQIEEAADDARIQNYHQCLEFLIASKFPLSDDYRHTPSALHLAITKGLPDIVKLLIDNNANLKEVCYASSYAGITALEIAEQHKKNKFNILFKTSEKYEQIYNLLLEATLKNNNN